MNSYIPPSNVYRSHDTKNGSHCFVGRVYRAQDYRHRSKPKRAN